jgi:hypothetical protein
MPLMLLYSLESSTHTSLLGKASNLIRSYRAMQEAALVLM